MSHYRDDNGVPYDYAGPGHVRETAMRTTGCATPHHKSQLEMTSQPGSFLQTSTPDPNDLTVWRWEQPGNSGTRLIVCFASGDEVIVITRYDVMRVDSDTWRQGIKKHRTSVEVSDAWKRRILNAAREDYEAVCKVLERIESSYAETLLSHA